LPAVTVEPEAHLYLRNFDPSAHEVAHFGSLPSNEEYGKHESVTIPVFSRYLNSVERFPPLQPKLVLSQATKSSGERTTSTPARQNLSDKTSDPANAQHEPHEA